MTPANLLIQKESVKHLIYRLKEFLIRSILWIEACVAVAVMATVVASGIDVMRLIKDMILAPAAQSYVLLQGILGHILLLIIGSELAIMLLKHTPGAVIEVMVYATARKLLMPAQMTDLLVGVTAIAALFAIRRFLFIYRIEENGESYILSAATTVDQANLVAGTNIPSDAAHSLGGVISNLAGNRTLAQGERFRIADADLEVVKIVDGVVESVKITKAPPKGVLWRQVK